MTDIPKRPTAAVNPVASVRDRKFDDPAFLDLKDETKDLSRHYRWVRVGENNQQIVRAKLKGYTVEKAKPGGVETVVETDKRDDGNIQIGDLILMSCPARVHDGRQQEKFRKSEARFAATTAVSKERAKELGISLIHEEGDSIPST